MPAQSLHRFQALLRRGDQIGLVFAHLPWLHYCMARLTCETKKIMKGNTAAAISANSTFMTNITTQHAANRKHVDGIADRALRRKTLEVVRRSSSVMVPQNRADQVAVVILQRKVLQIMVRLCAADRRQPIDRRSP